MTDTSKKRTGCTFTGCPERECKSQLMIAENIIATQRKIINRLQETRYLTDFILYITAERTRDPHSAMKPLHEFAEEYMLTVDPLIQKGDGDAVQS